MTGFKHFITDLYSGTPLKCFKKINNINSCFIVVKNMDLNKFVITVTASNLLESKPSNTLTFFLKDKGELMKDQVIIISLLKILHR